MLKGNEINIDHKTKESAINDYLKDVRQNSNCPETIEDKRVDTNEWEKVDSETVSKLRDKFANVKDKLVEDWEKKWTIMAKIQI